MIEQSLKSKFDQEIRKIEEIKLHNQRLEQDNQRLREENSRTREGYNKLKETYDLNDRAATPEMLRPPTGISERPLPS